eukprot:Amastigsp_a339417_404.p2 type:complete len:287 gc:universal Amastigsp_a339417_404:1-861(+)
MGDFTLKKSVHARLGSLRLGFNCFTMGIGDDFTKRLLIEAGVGAGARVLDAGCGPGDVTLIVAELVGASGAVVGLDRNEDLLQRARARAHESGFGDRVSVVFGDLSALTAVGLAPESFDFIVARRVLMYVPGAGDVVKAFVPLLKPGGVVVLHEHEGGAMAPACVDPGAFAEHLRIQALLRKVLEIEGCDPHMGLRLYGVAADAGLEVLRTAAEAVVQTPTQPCPIAMLLQIMKPRIVASGLVSEEQLDVPAICAHLDAEREAARLDTYVVDMMFGVIARRRALGL